MKYRAKGTFSTGYNLYKRGFVYDEIQDGYEGHFDKVVEVKEEKKIKGEAVETAAKLPPETAPKRRGRPKKQ